jgi:hypothetical protein
VAIEMHNKTVIQPLKGSADYLGKSTKASRLSTVLENVIKGK